VGVIICTTALLKESTKTQLMREVSTTKDNAQKHFLNYGSLFHLTCGDIQALL